MWGDQEATGRRLSKVEWSEVMTYSSYYVPRVFPADIEMPYFTT